jgi:hypothetical protein
LRIAATAVDHGFEIEIMFLWKIGITPQTDRVSRKAPCRIPWFSILQDLAG